MLIFAFLVWAVFIIITALIAGSKNRSVGGWAALGAFFGVFATIAVACCSRQPTEMEIATRREADPTVTKVCPRCAERVKAAAAICRFCNHEFDPATIPNIPIPALPQARALPWTLTEDHGGGYGVFHYKGDKLVYSIKGVKWKSSTFDNPTQAIAAIDGYSR